MSEGLDLMEQELSCEGYETRRLNTPDGQMVVFDYVIETGSHKNRQVQVGAGPGDGYPQYPPHWVVVSPPLDDGNGGVVNKHTIDGVEWLSMSRPPQDIWDSAVRRDMKTYLSDHLRRIWKDV